MAQAELFAGRTVQADPQVAVRKSGCDAVEDDPQSEAAGSAHSMRPIPQAQCLSLIHEFEKGPDGGVALVPYQDEAGNWTNGWGHRCEEDTPAITPAEADAQTLADLTFAATVVSNSLTNIMQLTDNQYAACIDLTFNIGMTNWNGSTLHQMLQNGAFHLAQAQFGVWNKVTINGVKKVSNGLVRRRAAEAFMFNQ